VVSFTPLPLYPRYSLERRLGGPQSRFGRRREEKIRDPSRTRTSDPSFIQLVASRYIDYAIPAHLLLLLLLVVVVVVVVDTMKWLCYKYLLRCHKKLHRKQLLVSDTITARGMTEKHQSRKWRQCFFVNGRDSHGPASFDKN
jgi:hypothetical protein